MPRHSAGHFAICQVRCGAFFFARPLAKGFLFFKSRGTPVGRFLPKKQTKCVKIMVLVC
jgi:hypothetical protein